MEGFKKEGKFLLWEGNHKGTHTVLGFFFSIFTLPPDTLKLNTVGGRGFCPNMCVCFFSLRFPWFSFRQPLPCSMGCQAGGNTAQQSWMQAIACILRRENMEKMELEGFFIDLYGSEERYLRVMNQLGVDVDGL